MGEQPVVLGLRFPPRDGGGMSGFRWVIYSTNGIARAFVRAPTADLAVVRLLREDSAPYYRVGRVVLAATDPGWP